MKRLRVTLVYEYDVVLDHYPSSSPLEMAELDIQQDPAVILDAEWTIEQARFTK